MYPAVTVSITLDSSSCKADTDALQTFARIVQYGVISLRNYAWS